MEDKPDYSMYMKIGKGLAIYRQKHSASYYVRIRIAKKNVQQCLKTTDQGEAMRAAIRLEDELKKRDFAGIPILAHKRVSIKEAFEGAMTILDNRSQQLVIYKSYKTVIINHLIPFFKGKSIEELTAKNIRLYYESRELSLTRKRMTNTIFGLLFQWLEEEGHIKKSDIPALPKVNAVKVENRNAFTNHDLKAIRKAFETFHEGARNFKTKEYRLTLKWYFELLVETGLRAGEEAKFKFSDIFKDSIDDEDHFMITIDKGKTKGYSKSRTLPLSQKAVEALINLAQIQNPHDEVNETNFNHYNKMILESSFGKVGDFVKIFKLLIDKLIEERIINRPYTLYSCRHYYITKRMANGVKTYLIGKYVGTSAEMIERHYDHAKHLMQIDNVDSINMRDREQELLDEQEEQREKELLEKNPHYYDELNDMIEEERRLKNDKEYQAEKRKKEQEELIAMLDLSDDYEPMNFDEE